MAALTTQDPVIVDIREPPDSELSQLGDVLFSALGVTGALLLLAVAFGAVLAGLMFWLRSRRM
jgi:hypothetical protein